MIYLICVINEGVLVKKGLLIKSNSEEEENHFLLKGKAASLAILYLYLISYSCSFLGRSLSIQNYFEPIDQWSS